MQRYSRKSERGSALFVAVLLVVVGFLTLMFVSELASNNFKRTDDYLGREQAFYAATGGSDFVVSDIWGKFLHERAVVQADEFYSFRNFLANKITFNTEGGTATLANQTTLDITNYNGTRLGNATISRVRLTRRDYNDPAGSTTLFTDLQIETEAVTDAGARVWASRVVGTKSHQPFTGLDFAVLTKNITCSLCHMHVQSLDKVLNTNASNFGKYSKIRVGTTELLAMRPGSANTLLEGALYHRGRIEEEFSGNAISYGTVTSSTVKTTSQDNEKGTVKQNLTNGAVEVISLNSTGVADTSSYRKTNGLDDDKDGTTDEADEGSGTRDRDSADNDGDNNVDESDEIVLYDPKDQRRVNSGTGVPNRNDSLYLEYPKLESQMEASDGLLPIDTVVDRYDPSKDLKAFPEPFKDLNGNRMIDTAEIDEQVATATKKDQTGPSTMNVPIGMRLAPGEVFGGGAMPAASGNQIKIGSSKTAATDTYSNRTASGVSLSGNSTNQGNYILVGTKDDPITIDGKVVIDGDVVIQGYVKGEGQIYATGNVYIPNDLKYANRVENGKEVFGENTDIDAGGFNKRNLMGVTAGGSIMVGDYISTVTHWNSGNGNFYDYGQPEIGRKLDRTKMPSLPDTGLNQLGGDNNRPQTNNVNFANFVMEELAFFNQGELARVTKKSKTGYNSNVVGDWNKGNVYNPSTNPTGLWRIPGGVEDANSTTSYIPRFYRMYGDIPEPSNSNPNLDYGRSYNGSTYQQISQNSVDNSPIPFYMNWNMKWDNGKGFYNNTGDPHTYNSIAEMKLNQVAGKWTYDTNFFQNGDGINDTKWNEQATSVAKIDNHYPTLDLDSRIPKDVLDTKAIENARVINIHPNWITPRNMLNLLVTEEVRRRVSGEVVPRQIDGLLYTNNSIFMIERKQAQYYDGGSYDPATGTWSGGTWKKRESESKGSFIVNGAIIAPDLGILVTGGTQYGSAGQKNFYPVLRGTNLTYERSAFTVNYDPRVKDLLYGISNKPIWNIKRKGWGRTLGEMP